MKVRWTDESVRFRITPTELGQLERGEAIHAELSLPGGGWTATVCLEPEGETRLSGTGSGTVTLYLSRADVLRLADPSAEGVYFRAARGDAPDGLRYYIEKDFPCLHPRPVEAEEQTETFAAPPDFAERERRAESC
jgi:hypothetical protein